MEFLWRELAVDPRFHTLASTTDTPLSSPVALHVTLRGEQQRFRPAGRVDRTPSTTTLHPVETANPAASEAFAAFVQYSLALLNDWSLTSAINGEFERNSPMVEQIMEDHARGGLLAVAAFVVSWDSAQAVGPADPSGRPPVFYLGGLSKRFEGLAIDTTVYGRPEHAYWRWRHTPRLEPGAAREGEYVDHKFFWGKWRQ